MISDSKSLVSPWFVKISQYYLKEMFDHLHQPSEIVKGGIVELYCISLKTVHYSLENHLLPN